MAHVRGAIASLVKLSKLAVPAEIRSVEPQAPGISLHDAGADGFFALSQCDERPETYGDPGGVSARGLFS